MHKGQYIDQIETWLKYYQRNQLLVLNFSDLIIDPKEVCNRVRQFIGLPLFDFEIRRVLNKGNYKQQMEDRCRDLLTENFRPYNRRLFQFLGEDWGWPS